jgi:hypothetical protein
MSEEQKITHLESKAKDFVRQAGAEGVSPRDLIKVLAQPDFDEDLVRMAIWELIDQQELRLSRDWILSIKSA